MHRTDRETSASSAPVGPPRSRRAAWIVAALLAWGCEREGSTAAASSRAASAATRPEQRSSDGAQTRPAVWRAVADLRQGGKTRVSYAPPAQPEAEQYAAWVTEAVEAAVHGAPPPREAPPGFELEMFEEGTLWLLREQSGQRRGAGAVLLRVGDASHLIVEAPHTFFDEGTLGLARQVFGHARARALVLNTAHRGNAANGLSEAALEEASRSGDLASDVAHAEPSFFQKAHEALIRAVPRPAVVQLHGYRDGTVPADAVVSAAGGSLNVAPLVEKMRALLPRLGIARHGHDTKALGGTTNVQARDAHTQNVPFLHLELSHRLRTRLRKDDALRDSILEALVALLSS